MNRQEQWERNAERDERERYREAMGYLRPADERRAERLARAKTSSIKPRKLSEVLGHTYV
ncbi:hypothetical protein [Falsarthrobacter nasiphocae]|uniref:Uncharacterized protein n=1 Tax=Falsarthrobacter nasiphocae TaxID=189863 RepID=A0AAE3YH32_9MICC|nr:hypothetical protein [Falsarthrobacter nasiphocae]MDR6891808.1 hypothetical protein [Falsarthrobacter nasiphocae]